MTSVVPQEVYKRVGIVSAQMDEKIIAPLQYDGTMDSILFEQWVEECLIPALPEKSAVIMDNTSFHRKKKLAPFPEASGHKPIFLPPYSPELSPV